MLASRGVHATKNIFYCKCQLKNITQISPIDDESMCTCALLFPNFTDIESKSCVCEHEDGDSLLIQVVVIGMIGIYCALAVVLMCRPVYRAHYERLNARLSSSGLSSRVLRTRLQTILDTVFLEPLDQAGLRMT
eukprot:CFRG8332T1